MCRATTHIGVLLVVTIAISAVVVPAPAATHLVPSQYSTIQAAVNASASGDVILVSGGTYPERVVIAGKGLTISATDGPDATNVLAFYWSDGVPFRDMTISGFAVADTMIAVAVDAAFTLAGCRIGGTVSVTAIGGYESGAACTVSDCAFSTNVRVLGGGAFGNFSVERCLFEVGVSLDLSGLFVWATGNRVLGGDLEASGANALTVSGNEVEGGGIEAGTGTVGDVFENTVRNGTGIRISHEIQVIGNVIESCTMGIEMSPSGSVAFVPDCRDNLVADCVEGVRIIGYIDHITGNTIVGCSGTGLYLQAGNTDWYTLDRNLIASNGIGVHVATSAASMIECNDVWDNSGGNWVGIPDPTGWDANFSLDPIFCAPSISWYALAATSPCLPGNHPTGAACGQIGALGQECDAPVGVELPGAGPAPLTALLPAAPNPFSRLTRIAYVLHDDARVRLDVFNSMGQRVATLVDGVRSPGRHEVPFDAADLPAGVYYYRLDGRVISVVERMTVVR